ncbi:unnamed protein product [Nesidiocoris tenuis]|uniref:Uncharacterized protein n=1 Tax=Nesidiocoris tenuis TaxID=355587 RepID=A0A6H5G4X0_9HEMI|nr:unnamed protein product [Nesidiocoris tenuis]
MAFRSPYHTGGPFRNNIMCNQFIILLYSIFDEIAEFPEIYDVEICPDICSQNLKWSIPTVPCIVRAPGHSNSSFYLIFRHWKDPRVEEGSAREREGRRSEMERRPLLAKGSQTQQLAEPRSDRMASKSTDSRVEGWLCCFYALPKMTCMA